MGSAVWYLMTGPAHLARFAVSLWSLRKHWAGRVLVYTTREPTRGIIKRWVETDQRANVTHHHADIQTNVRRSNRQFVTKVWLAPQLGSDTYLYLDADTLVLGPVDPLLDAASEHGVCVTQWNDWTTASKIIGKRLDGWLKYADQIEWLTTMRERLRTDPMPSVNGGVFAFKINSPMFAEWHRLCVIGQGQFICDEVALHYVYPLYPHAIGLDGVWNWAPDLMDRPDGARIAHFHGDKHFRPASAPMWTETFREVWDANFCGIREWAPANDDRLRDHWHEVVTDGAQPKALEDVMT